MKKAIPFEEFEQAVMSKIMERDNSINIILREQYNRSHVISRDFTGVGFFTTFEVATEASRITEPVPNAYGDVEAIINGIGGYGFILFIKNGTMSFLEGYTWRDEWPKLINNFVLVHSDK
ncbi:hypothetical protein HYX58_01050 [Candidatus Dependentiae bacterium]|nr:hypothetical protein [Candidatus Dependentiae bacterium]